MSDNRNGQTHWSITPTGVFNTCPFGTPNGWLKRVLNPRWVAVATVMTTPWPETINGLYKAELIHHRGPWKSRESVELATLQWVHWFNHIRLLEPIRYIPPAEAEANYWRQLDQKAETAHST